MLTIGTAVLHIGASVLGGLTTAAAVEWWRARHKPPAKAPTPSTGGIVRTVRRNSPKTGAVDPFSALRRVVESVPFYGPPWAFG
jgi:hypothetical protein